MIIAGVTFSAEDLKVFGVASAAGIVYWQNHRQSKKVDKAVTKVTNASAEVTEVKNQLTTTNGGSHVKDQLNRIEEQLEVNRLWSERMERFTSALSKKLSNHLEWSADNAASLHSEVTKLKEEKNG